MKKVTDKYQLAWIRLKLELREKLHEYTNAESLGFEISDYAEIEMETIEEILQNMEEKEQKIKRERRDNE